MKQNPVKSPIRQEVDRILDQRDEKLRLREAFELWLKVNPKVQVSYSDGSKAWVTARLAYAETLEKIKFLRSMHETKIGVKHQAKHKRGVGSMGMRSMMEFPPGAIQFLRMFHMEMFSGSGQEQKKAIMKLSRIFPEFVVPEKL